MKIRDYYPSNIIKRFKRNILLQKVMLRQAYITFYPRQYELYRIILSYYNGDEKATKEFIEEHGFVDPKLIYVPHVEYIIDDSSLDDDFSSIFEEVKKSKK